MNGLNSTFSFLDDIQRHAAGVFDSLAEQMLGKPHTLRDGTEHDAVELPRDLAAHDNVQTEWWYYTGHGKTDSGREFGFEWVFFKRRTDQDKFAVVPLRLIGNPFYFAHFAISDIRENRFTYSHRKSANGPLDVPASASKAHDYLNIGDWTARESHGLHMLRASLDTSTTFEVALRPTKPVVLNGVDGVSFKDEGEASRYFAYTRMDADGHLVIDGKPEHFTGSAWMDREFGTWAPTENQKGWDWFSIQLDNNCELMCYQLRDSKGNVSSYSSGTYVDEAGNATQLTSDDFRIKPVGVWKSQVSGAEYPSVWKLEVPKFGLDLRVVPVIEDQEVDTRGTTMIVYWEGACRVNGEAGGKSISGKAYVELVGYDRSHESPNLAYFLLGNPNELLGKLGFKQ